MSNIVCNLIFLDLINGFIDRAPIIMHIIALTRSLTIQTKRKYRDLSDAATAVQSLVKRPRVVFRRRRGRDVQCSGTNQLLGSGTITFYVTAIKDLGLEKQLSIPTGESASH
jgi:hypothetical protein